MNGKFLSGAISSIAAYLAGIFFKYLHYMQPESFLIDAQRQAIRDNVTYYLQNTSFIVGISVGLLTAFFLIKNNIKKSKEEKK